jgi:hypothetical protein
VGCGHYADLGGGPADRLFLPQRPDAATVPTRELSAWLSPRDAAELVRAAVEAVGFIFVVANGISANRYRRADHRSG